MSFTTGQLAVQAVNSFAIHQGKSVVVSHRSGMDRKMKCSSDHCTYTLQVYRKQTTAGTYGEWYISWVRDEHINCVSTPKPTKTLVSENPTFHCAVNTAPTIAAKTLVLRMSSRESVSLQVQKRSVYQARDIVNEAVLDTMNVVRVHTTFTELNPGTIAVFERDQHNQFKRFLIFVKVIADSMEVNQRVLGIDCTYSKGPWYDGVQMNLVDQDSNRETAIFLCTYLENYDWFIKRLIDGGSKIKNHVLFCDRAIVSVPNSLEINVRFCTLHIIRNGHHNMVWRLQPAQAVETYKIRLGCIDLALGVVVRNCLERMSPVKWCVHANIAIWPLYG
ncbi:hypothetical protein PHMEG_000374 [Phytophthora megakarya]|uniref:MULE transposase domain-containing protein n=1 Tax=Phytophthora megakarya TaxID=4795 RepID=A0A225X477_9STRA|nr:hypothetical protein PHMEG_000374 [Phytophthora megakarya]